MARKNPGGMWRAARPVSSSRTGCCACCAKAARFSPIADYSFLERRNEFRKTEPGGFCAGCRRGSFDGHIQDELSPLSGALREGWDGPDCLIHRGPLAVQGHFEAPGYFTLITGDLTVEGLVDLHNPYDKGFDEGGIFVVLGDLTCHAFANEYGKCSFIDGNLNARDILLNDFGDSCLFVTGDLATRFFYGRDIWAEIGGVASMDYGDGYCLPIGYRNAGAEAMRPRHDEDASLRLLNVESFDGNETQQMLAMLREGRPVFK